MAEGNLVIHGISSDTSNWPSNSADSLKRLSITDQLKAPFSCRWHAHKLQLFLHLVEKEGECVFHNDGRHSRRPVDSIRDAVLTVSPNRQYRGMVRPTTPATTGPAKHNRRSSHTGEATGSGKDAIWNIYQIIWVCRFPSRVRYLELIGWQHSKWIEFHCSKK